MLRTTWAPHLPQDVGKRAAALGLSRRCYSSSAQTVNAAPPWRPSAALDEWVDREARPISLRQLTVFGRTLTESRLLSSANYVRLELPTRIAHRLRNMQTLPYTALTNRHISQVHELYYAAFERLRKVPEVRTLADNNRLCQVIRDTLREHLSVIPSLAMGVLELRPVLSPEGCDRLMTTMLRSRISRRVIAEQHLALTESFHSPNPQKHEDDDSYVGQVLLKCSASEIVSSCAANMTRLVRRSYGRHVKVPKVVLSGDLDSTFPYIPSHIEYIIGELLRNSIQASISRFEDLDPSEEPPPIDVLICDTQQQLIIRVSDQAGGVDPEILPYLWSFARGPRRDRRLRNLERVPRLAGVAQEVAVPPSVPPEDKDAAAREQRHRQKEQEKKIQQQEKKPLKGEKERYPSSLSSITARPPDLRLGIGLPISRIYAEYWAGSLALHSLEGYGTDAFLQISKLGNRNEVLSTRATMDGL